MDTHRSYCLASRMNDFAESASGKSRIDRTDFHYVHYVMPANDNLRTKDRLSARCAALLGRLITLHRLKWPT
jgi:hypothetical protein